MSDGINGHHTIGDYRKALNESESENADLRERLEAARDALRRIANNRRSCFIDTPLLEAVEALQEWVREMQGIAATFLAPHLAPDHLPDATKMIDEPKGDDSEVRRDLAEARALLEEANEFLSLLAISCRDDWHKCVLCDTGWQDGAIDAGHQSCCIYQRVTVFLAAHPAPTPDEFSIHCANCYWRWTGAMCHGPHDRMHCPVLAGRDLGAEWRQAAGVGRDDAAHPAPPTPRATCDSIIDTGRAILADANPPVPPQEPRNGEDEG